LYRDAAPNVHRAGPQRNRPPQSHG